MKSLQTIITNHQHKKSLKREQKDILDKFSKIELLMLCDRYMDQTIDHRSVEDILELEEMSQMLVLKNIESFQLLSQDERMLVIEESQSFEEIVILNASSFIITHEESLTQESDEVPPFHFENEDTIAGRDFETLVLQMFSNHGFILREFMSGSDELHAWYDFNLVINSSEEDTNLSNVIKLLKETDSKNIEVIHRAKKSDKAKRKISVKFTFSDNQLDIAKRDEVVI